MAASNATIQTVALTALDPAPGNNPNVMSTERYELLRAAIERGEFYQPILVRPTPGAPGRFTVVDGMHRWKAAADLGYAGIPAVVAHLDEHEARAVRIGMNRLRGELDLGVVAREVADLKLAGWKVDEMTITGFSIDEIDALVRNVMASPDDVMNAPAGSVHGDDEDEEEANPRPYVFEATFATRADLARVKRALRKAAGGGKGADMAKGLLRLIDGA